MKKHLLLSLACALLLGACGDKETPWFHNANVVVRIEVADGGNMLDEDYPLNILHNGVTVTYKGETYPLTGVPPSRAEYVPPTFGGLRLQTSWNVQIPPCMVFGEFGIVSDAALGVKEYRGEKFTIDWGGGAGQTSDVEFDLYAAPGGDGGMTVRSAVRVTGGVGAGTQSENSLSLVITLPAPLQTEEER